MTERSLDYARKEGVTWAIENNRATKEMIAKRVSAYREIWGNTAAICFQMGIEQQFEIIGH